MSSLFQGFSCLRFGTEDATIILKKLKKRGERKMKKLALLLTILASLSVTTAFATEHQGVLECDKLVETDRFSGVGELNSESTSEESSEGQEAQDA